MTKEELLNGEFLKQFKDSKDFGYFMIRFINEALKQCYKEKLKLI